MACGHSRALGGLAAATILLAGERGTASEYFVAPGGTGSGMSADPFGSIQAAVDAAQPGDVVTIRPGTYAELIQTQRDGSSNLPITIRAEPGEAVVIERSGRGITVDHAHHIVEGIVFDALFGAQEAVDVNDGATGLILRNIEAKNTTRNCINMGAPSDVLIEGALIHHCLAWSGGRVDAHGVTGGAVRNLTLRNTTIHTFSGDAIQFDPGRDPLVGWDNVLLEGCSFWLEPLPAPIAGFPAGVAPGENAFDTKIDPAHPRARLVVRNTVAWGFEGGLITNMAAFNIKERVDALFDGVTVHSSEIAFRLRGAPLDGGAHVRVQNAVVYDVAAAFRYEDDIENLRIYNTTLGLDVVSSFVEANAGASVLDVRNLLVLGTVLPGEASYASNFAVDESAFIDAAAGDYRLAAGSPAVDSGVTVDGVLTDRVGVARPQGAAFDVGAFEHCDGCADAGTGSGAGGASGSGAPPARAAR